MVLGISVLLLSPQNTTYKSGTATATVVRSPGNTTFKSGSATFTHVTPTKESIAARKFFMKYRGPRISVLPVFYVPYGEEPPSEASKSLFLSHAQAAQRRYLEFMGGRDTFQLVPNVLTYYSRTTASWLSTQPNEGKAPVLREIMTAQRLTRSSTPYVYLVVVAGGGGFPHVASGRPINGGHNNGGGIVLASQDDMDRDRGFQSSLQHELGHAFGLPHVDQYGYSMKDSPSFMSYNPHHRSSGISLSPTPAIAIPEDLRGLSLNWNVFPKFGYSLYDLPGSYMIKRERCPFPPMEL